MSEPAHNPITIRPMVLDDLGRVPMRCQGDAAEIGARIRALGSSAMLAFDGGQHVGQLQFRAYDPALRSPNGLWDPLYWGDFGAHAPVLPARSLAIFCYHVGQLDDTDRRDTRYQGRGIGLALLDAMIVWASGQGFEAIIAKATPSDRKVMGFMGGQPREAYVERGFELVSSRVDPQLRQVIQDKNLVSAGADLDEAARVGCCVGRLRR